MIHHSRQHQEGTALLVAMVMLFMMSIMGISAMRGSTLEKRMAINSVKSATVFHAAESTSDAALNDTNNLTKAYNLGVGQNKKIGGEVDLQSTIANATHEYELQYTGEGLAPGFSTGFVTLRFEATGISKIKGARAQSVVQQGAYRVVPK